jgi:hypothetical protein
MARNRAHTSRRSGAAAPNRAEQQNGIDQAGLAARALAATPAPDPAVVTFTTNGPAIPAAAPATPAAGAPAAPATPAVAAAPAVRAPDVASPAPAAAPPELPAPIPAVGRDSKPVATESAAPATRHEVAIEVTLIRGGITNVAASVAVTARYDGLALAGSAKSFDRLIGSWLSRALDFGMIGSRLGQVFTIDLRGERQAGKVKIDQLLLAGMGEPGRFTRDDLRFLTSNVMVALKRTGCDTVAMSLIGTRRREMPVAEAVRALLEGVLDADARFRAIAESAGNGADRPSPAPDQPLRVLLVDPDGRKLTDIESALKSLGRDYLQGLRLKVTRGADVEPDPLAESSMSEAEADLPATLLRVTRNAATPSGPGAAPSGGTGDTEIFQFSALSDVSVVTVREQEISRYLINQLPDRLSGKCAPEMREGLARLFANCVIPEDFRSLTESSPSLTLEVDETTALYPWEMLAHKKYARTNYVGTNTRVSRQFRSVLSPAPSSPPPLNHNLNVLIIADPASGGLALPNARTEGFAVLEVLDQARRAWQGEYNIRATVRIGSHRDDDQALDTKLKDLDRQTDWIDSADRCDPLEIVMLIVNEQYDVIHYAGHGFFDAKTRRAGWVLERDCNVSAQEIFRVRQVPRLVFANACFSAVAPGDSGVVDHAEQRKRLVGVAQAFFARGIPNFIGAGWQVDDACACVCARWFYGRVLGLGRPDYADGTVAPSAPDTIGASLLEARIAALRFNGNSSTWGAYQHYGRVADRLLARPKVRAAARPDAAPAPPTVFSVPSLGAVSMSTTSPAAAPAAPVIDPDQIYVNGINAETGTYAVPPTSIGALAKNVRAHPGVGAIADLHGESPRSFGLPPGITYDKLDEAGWGIVFHEDTPADVRAALAPLIAARSKQAGPLFKELDYRHGEQTRDWYLRHKISAGNPDPEIVPYYLLLVGPPTQIPFEFQYLLGIEYAVGRLAFDAAADYAQYARSVVDYESAAAVPNGKEIVYFGTRHLGDGATNLSSSLLIDPLANGIAGAAGKLKTPVSTEVGYAQQLLAAEQATKDALIATLSAKKPPALLFTASHGMLIPSGRPNQRAIQGALLCQDWPGFGSIRPDHYLTASDVPDDAHVHGLVALVFACFGAGTPDIDQFVLDDLSQAGALPPLAPEPFIAALPQRLLTHPNGGALAVIGHIDRAWGFSIQPPKQANPQIGPFRNSLGYILRGSPVGHAVTDQFGGRFAALSAALLSAISPTAPAAMKLNDRDLVTYWLERNDAQNYVMLGDPAARIRKDALQ